MFSEDNDNHSSFAATFARAKNLMKLWFSKFQDIFKKTFILENDRNEWRSLKHQISTLSRTCVNHRELKSQPAVWNELSTLWLSSMDLLIASVVLVDYYEQCLWSSRSDSHS